MVIMTNVHSEVPEGLSDEASVRRYLVSTPGLTSGYRVGLAEESNINLLCKIGKFCKMICNVVSGLLSPPGPRVPWDCAV